LSSDQHAPAAARTAPRTAGGAAAVEARPFYADPLRIAGWALALLALASYWWLFERRPPVRPGTRTARLTIVAGHVRVRPFAREAWVEARLGMALQVGDAVRTDPGAAAQIWFDSGNVVRVRPDSIVYLGGTAEASTSAWRLDAGRASFVAGSEGADIETAALRAHAQANASGQLDVGDSGTGLKIFRGQAELQTTLGDSLSLLANQAVQVDAAGRLGAPVALPPAPTLLAPGTRSTLPFASPPAPVALLRWTQSSGAASYHVAMDFNVTQADLLLSAALDVPGITDTSHELRGVDPGRYFWRVAGVTADGVEGEFSRVFLFSVLPPEPAKAAPEPEPAPAVAPLALEPLAEVGGGVVRVAGRAEPGSAVTVDGVAIRVQPDGTFGEYVRLRAGGSLVVRGTTREGRTSERTLRAGGR
jgi:hypothetical protein